MPNRRKPMPTFVRQEDTALAGARLNPGQEQSPSATSEASGNQANKNPAQKNQGRGGWSHHGRALNKVHANGHNQDNETLESQYKGSNGKDKVWTLIRDHRIDAANRVVMTLLYQRIAAGDSELCAATMLLEHNQIILSQQSPLLHIGTLPLSSNNHLHACFNQLVELIRQQQNQMSELQAIIGELI